MTSNVVKAKPVASVGTAATVVTAVLTYLAYRGVIPTDLVALLDPVAVALAAAAMHALVSPYAKVKAVIEQGLHITDADYGRLEALLEQYGLELVDKKLDPAPATQPAGEPVPAAAAADPAAPAAS